MHYLYHMKTHILTLLLTLACTVCKAQSYYEWVEKADSCIELQEWSKAEDALQNALRAEPANAQNALLLSNLGTVQRYCGKYEDALKTYSIALFMTPRSTVLLRNRAALYAEMDSLSLACDDYSHILLLDDTDEDALYNRALIYMELNDTLGCRNDLERLLQLNPGSSKARMGFATFFKAQGYYTEAIEMYNQVLRENADNASLYIGRAESYLLAGRPSLADKDIIRALELTPNDPFIYMLRAWAKIERFEDADAMRDIERARQLGYDPDACNRFIDEIKKKK